VKRISNQEYSRPSSGALLMDLYLPTATPARRLPVVIWIHGGGWKIGSKENCPLTWLVPEGYAVVSLGYRLSWMARWPAQMDDARAAIRWLRTNADRYQLDATRIAVSGGSSGGNLASIVGTAPLPPNESVSSRVGAVIDFYGAADMLTMPTNVLGDGITEADLANSNGAKLLGAIPRDRPDLARSVSPLHQVSKDDPPFLIIHGDKDTQVPIEQSRRLHAKLKETGVPSELIVLPGAGHGGKEFSTPEVKAAIQAFLHRSLTGR
jgi:acetyl esterase/lipase